jgi:competence protein ComEA
MNSENVARGASPRALGASSGPESGSVLSPASHRPRGRTAAPRVTSWLPAAAKVAAAVLAAAVLAIIGATAGARPPAQEPIAAPIFSASAAPATVANAPAPVVDPPAVASGDAGAEPSSGVTADGRVILNAASEDELTKLPGIGPSRARAIVALRQRLAKFRAVEDLLRVKGIGRKTLRRIKPNVVLDRPAVAAPSSSG